MSRVLQLLLFLLLLSLLGADQIALSQSSNADLDEQLLRSAGLPTDDAGLLAFFTNRTLRASDRPVLERLMVDLSSSELKVRQKADRELTLRGPVALPFLKEGLKGASLETTQRI